MDYTAKTWVNGQLTGESSVWPEPEPVPGSVAGYYMWYFLPPAGVTPNGTMYGSTWLADYEGWGAFEPIPVPTTMVGG